MNRPNYRLTYRDCSAIRRRQRINNAIGIVCSIVLIAALVWMVLQ